MQPFNPPRVELNRDVFNAASSQVRPPAEAPRAAAPAQPLFAPAQRRRSVPHALSRPPAPRRHRGEARIRALESANPRWH